MKFASLGSGSKGNATLVCSDKAAVLIDCGFNRKHALLRLQQLDFDPQKLTAVFVTHEHSDHSKGVVHLCETLKIPFFSSYGTAQKSDWLEHPQWHCIIGAEPVELHDLKIVPVIVPHDSQEPIQFVIQNAKYKLGVLSDLGCVTPHVIDAYSDCHGLCLEANHDVQLLQQGPYPPSLKRRVAGDYGHLNNQQAAYLLSKIISDKTQHVIATHISEKNNQIDLVRQSFAQVLNCSAQQVKVAEQGCASDWFYLS